MTTAGRRTGKVGPTPASLTAKVGSEGSNGVLGVHGGTHTPCTTCFQNLPDLAWGMPASTCSTSLRIPHPPARQETGTSSLPLLSVFRDYDTPTPCSSSWVTVHFSSYISNSNAAGLAGMKRPCSVLPEHQTWTRVENPPSFLWIDNTCVFPDRSWVLWGQQPHFHSWRVFSSA